MRIALGLEYNGHHFHGWQLQKGLTTVQETLTRALSHIANESVKLYCAGRTDKGVHAIGQVIHFDTHVKRPLTAWIQGANTYLPPSVSVCWAELVSDHFHARFTAQSRCYRYIIFNHTIRPAVLNHQVSWYPYPLQLHPMQEAVHYLIGEHDFSSFRASECHSKTPMRYMMHVNLERRDHFIMIEMEANAFLQHMVRNIVGTLLRIGSGMKSPRWMQEVLMAKNRCVAASTASPDGLYLVQVRYPPPYLFPMPRTLLF